MAAVTTGTSSQGMKYSGFSTMGMPKMMGSLMLNTPMGAASLAMVLESSRLEKKRMAMIRPRVRPEPPIMV